MPIKRWSYFLCHVERFSVKHLTFMQVEMFLLTPQRDKKGIMLSITRLQCNQFIFIRVKERIAAHLFTLYAIVKYKVNKIKGVFCFF